MCSCYNGPSSFLSRLKPCKLKRLKDRTTEKGKFHAQYFAETRLTFFRGHAFEQEITKDITKAKIFQLGFSASFLLKRNLILICVNSDLFSICYSFIKSGQRFSTLDTRFSRFSRHFNCLASFLEGVKCRSLHRSVGPFSQFKTLLYTGKD